MYYNNILELIGNTPLVKLSKLKEELGLKGDIFAKLERFNPQGSHKDRAALYMIKGAMERGEIKENTVIIEPTSGNTGIGLAFICSYMNLRCVLTMPESMSEERKKLLRYLGAELILTPAAEGMKGAIKKAEEIAEKEESAFIPSQFSNKDNVRAHIETTGPEILADLGGEVDFFVAGVGSGGTVSGVGSFLKSKNSDIKIVAVEPQSSPMISKGISAPHKIQGIGANFVPENYDPSVVDEVITVSDEDALKFQKLICKLEGIFSGISSGAALCAAAKIAEKESGNVVVLLSDTGDRYLSSL